MASATKLGGAPGRLDGKFGEYGAGEVVGGPPGPFPLQRAHRLGEFFQAEDQDRVIEQAELRTRWMLRHAATVNRAPEGRRQFSAAEATGHGHGAS